MNKSILTLLITFFLAAPAWCQGTSQDNNTDSQSRVVSATSEKTTQIATPSSSDQLRSSASDQSRAEKLPWLKSLGIKSDERDDEEGSDQFYQLSESYLDGASENLASTNGPGTMFRSREDRRHPLRAIWRQWCASPKPFGRSLVFIGFVTTLFTLLMPRGVDASVVALKSSFWRSLGLGLVTTAICVTFSRLMLFSVGLPLALVILGLMQLGVLIGLAVFATLLGGGLCGLVKCGRVDDEKHPRFKRILTVLAASVILALLLQVRLPGHMVGLGIRLIVLMAIAGMGAFGRVLRSPEFDR